MLFEPKIKIKYQIVLVSKDKTCI